MAQIDAERARDQAKFQADKEHTRHEITGVTGPSSSSDTSATVELAPCNRDPKLPGFVEEKDELDSYLLYFERQTTS